MTPPGRIARAARMAYMARDAGMIPYPSIKHMASMPTNKTRTLNASPLYRSERGLSSLINGIVLRDRMIMAANNTIIPGKPAIVPKSS